MGKRKSDNKNNKYINMEENKNYGMDNMQQVDEGSSFDFKTIYKILVLNWQWFILSLVVCLGLAYAYLRYTTPIHMATAKMLVKEDESAGRSRNGLMNTATLGIMSNSSGFDNEMEILKSSSIAKDAVVNLKLYTSYVTEGKIKDHILYKNQPITVDIDGMSLESLDSPIKIEINRKGNNYKVEARYFAPSKEGEEFVPREPLSLSKTLSNLPARVGTRVGTLTFSATPGLVLNEGTTLKVTIVPPAVMAARYAGGLSIAPTSKTTSIALLSLTDPSPQRAIDYLEELVDCYNQQANDDKNEIANRTEEFINQRLQKISNELGNTEGSIEQFKKNNQMVELEMSASQSFANANVYDQKLIDLDTQIALFNSISEFIAKSDSYELIPSNVGLSDASSTTLINNFNKIALERKEMLRSAKENSPVVVPLTEQLNDLRKSIHSALNQAKKSLEIQRQSIMSQYNKYQSQILSSPQQQRVMNSIGRQQEVQTSLYTMLLQKREENSISLAATANKGRLIDKPSYSGLVKPKKSMIMMIGLILGLGIPFAILFLINFFRYKIEGHEDVAKLAQMPVIADVAVASETAKDKADIVVHENTNNMMEEIFRSMRTNLQFMLSEGQKVIMATSSIAGEGKTFNISNLAISFALLGKKVVLVGLDIRKPRLAELFEIHDHKHGITPLLTLAQPTVADVKAQIVPSGVNNNLDILMAGPVPPNPAELVERQQLDEVINILKSEYDYVLIDTAPVGLVTDTLQIGRVADATIVVVRADYTPKDNILMLNDLSKEGKLKNMAIVINGIDMSKKKYGYYYGYGKYGKYGHYGRSYKSYGSYGSYGHYGHYGSYGNYSNSSYADKNDTSVKL